MASWWDTVWREARTTVGRRAKRFAPSSDSPPPLPPRGVGGIVVEEEEGPDGWDVVAVNQVLALAARLATLSPPMPKPILPSP